MRMVRYLAGKTRRLVAMARGTATHLHPALRDVEIVLGDVSVASEIDRALDGIDVVIHLAGHSGAASSVQDPIHDLHENVAGLLTLLEGVRRRGNPVRIVFPGSRLEYGRPRALPAAETDLLQPLSPYGVNKYACEMYLDLYSRLYGMSYAVARLTNPYGPSANAGAREYNVFNRLIAIAAQGGTINLYGEGAQLRDYVYVDDVVHALAMLAAHRENVVANVGSGQGVSLRAAAEAIVRVAGRGTIECVPWPATAKQVETGDFIADITRMRALGWSPSTSLEDGIRETLDFIEVRA